MSNQAEHENQQTLTPEKVREVLLEASQQAIAELNDEELEAIAGGGFSFGKPMGRPPMAPQPPKPISIKGTPAEILSKKLHKILGR